MADFEKVYKIKFDTSQARGAIKRLDKNADKLGRAIDKSVGEKGVRAVNKLKKSADRASLSFKKMGDRMKGAGRWMSTRVTLPIVAAGAAAIKFASDYEEAINKVDVAFKDSAGEVKEFAKTTLKQFGLAEGSALDMAALFGDMGTSMGLSTAEAAKMSTQLVALSGDLASFKNIGIEQAQTALAGIFTGETESLKRIGYMPLIKNLQKFMDETGRKGNFKDLDQSEQVMIRYAFITKAAANAQGDFERTGGGAANQARKFTEGLKQLAQTFGKRLLPMFISVVEKLNAMIEKWIALDDSTKDIILGVAGFLAVAGPMLIIVGKLTTAISALSVASAGLAGVKGLGALAGKGGTIAIITAGFLGWAVAISAVVKNWGFLKNALGDWWDSRKPNAGDGNPTNAAINQRKYSIPTQNQSGGYGNEWAMAAAEAGGSGGGQSYTGGSMSVTVVGTGLNEEQVTKKAAGEMRKMQKRMEADAKRVMRNGFAPDR